MHEEQMTRMVKRAIRVSQTAWDRAHEGLPSNVMTRSASIPATGILAVTLLEQLDEDDATITARAEAAIRIARRAWEQTHREPPGNPIATTATRSVVGILAAGILNHEQIDRAKEGARREEEDDEMRDVPTT